MVAMIRLRKERLVVSPPWTKHVYHTRRSPVGPFGLRIPGDFQNEFFATLCNRLWDEKVRSSVIHLRTEWTEVNNFRIKNHRRMGESCSLLGHSASSKESPSMFEIFSDYPVLRGSLSWLMTMIMK